MRHYRTLRAHECLAELEGAPDKSWFGRYLPQDRVLGDPGMRDASIHAIQACIPQARLLPVGVGRISVAKTPGPVGSPGGGTHRPVRLLHAVERAQTGDIYHYEVTLLTEDGQVLETWENLRLRRVEPIQPREPWPAALLSPCLERRLAELAPEVSLALSLQTSDQRDEFPATQEVFHGLGIKILYRQDGKPESTLGESVSASHAGPLTLVVAGSHSVGCDLEVVKPRLPERWRDLLGPERFRLAETVAATTGESLDAAATRVWCALECLKKAGAAPDAPLVYSGTKESRTVFRQSARWTIATWLESVQGFSQPLGIGVLWSGSNSAG